MRIAQVAPNHAPSRLPQRRLTMIVQWLARSVKETVVARNGRAVATTTKLVALLRMTASRAAKRNNPISNGKRNSAPQVTPPKVPMIAPLTKDAIG